MDSSRIRVALVQTLVAGLLIAAVIVLSLPWGGSTKEFDQQGECRDKLHLIGIALHDYAEANDGYLPPAVVVSPDGKPLYSWRVLILPYIEMKWLYDQFRLDEPWDSPHNSEWSQANVKAFQCSKLLGEKDKDGYPLTSYFAVVGKHTPMQMGTSTTLPAITEADGTANTIMVVELYSRPLPWAAPDQLTPTRFLADYRPCKQPPCGHIPHPGGGHAMMCDGMVRQLPPTLKIIHRLLTFNRREPVPRW